MDNSLLFSLLEITLKYKLPLSTYKLLAEWLGVYIYVLPKHRKLVVFPNATINCPLDLVITHMQADLLFSCVPPELQLAFANTPYGREVKIIPETGLKI